MCTTLHQEHISTAACYQKGIFFDFSTLLTKEKTRNVNVKEISNSFILFIMNYD